MEGSYNGKGLACLCADTVLRLGLGVMFLYSAWGKILDPGAFQTMVDNYRMLPAGVTAIFAATMSMAELLVGAMFIFSKWTREAAFATAVMLAMFSRCSSSLSRRRRYGGLTSPAAVSARRRRSPMPFSSR